MEIERKWRVAAEAVPPEVLAICGEAIDQGYLAIEPGGREVRLRRRGGRCTLTVKAGAGLVREEHEVDLDPAAFARLWPATLGRRLEKVRRVITGSQAPIELDVYGGALVGLLVAEVEFTDEAAAQRFVAPAWFGSEVTGVAAFGNQRLAQDGLPRIS